MRGFGGTFAGMVERLDHLADLGVDVIELMPVHPFDSADNYWGYMPLVWGAVHRPYAPATTPPSELATRSRPPHERGMRGVARRRVQPHRRGRGDPADAVASRARRRQRLSATDPMARTTTTAGAATTSNPADPNIRHLVLEALERFADLGIDGFRFDLASLLTRDGGGLIEQITGMGVRGRGVRLIAEPWDLGAYMLGDRSGRHLAAVERPLPRPDAAASCAARPGSLPAVMQRVPGSPDVFGRRAARRQLRHRPRRPDAARPDDRHRRPLPLVGHAATRCACNN